MGWIYKNYIRPELFKLDPEFAHHLCLKGAVLTQKSPWLMSWIRALSCVEDPRLNIQLGPLRFSNPLGLAAGLDKNGVAPQFWSALGFGSIEIGSVSADPSTGNDVRPRLFRLPQDEAIVVYYGVPNEGAVVIAERMKTAKCSNHSNSLDGDKAKVGINFVETHRKSSLEVVLNSKTECLNEELVRAMRNFLGDVSDFWTLNANCPNTGAGASNLTEPTALRSLLDTISDQIGAANIPPLLIKQTIETNPALARQWIALALEYPFILGFSFNLPPGIPYELKTPKEQYEKLPGTLTGGPIRRRINQAMKIWSKELENTCLGLVVAGGVSSAETLYEKVLLGASVTQIYTGLVYHGPGIVKSSLSGLLRLLEEDGFQNAQEAVGQWREFPHRITE